MNSSVKVLFDWLTFTIRCFADPEQVIKYILGLDPADFEQANSPLSGYMQAVEYGNIYVCYAAREDEKFQNFGICVSMSGKGCRTFEDNSKLHRMEGCTDAQGLINPAFSALFQLLHSYGDSVHITRIDIACDDHVGLLDLDLIWDKLNAKEYNSRLASYGQNRSFKHGQCLGNTIYIGSKSSDFYVRCYDKAKQLFKPSEDGFHQHYVRLEMVLKHENAQEFMLQFVNSESIGSIAAGILREKLNFIDRDDTNISRCSLCDWWSKFLGLVEVVQLASRADRETTIKDKRDYLAHSMAQLMYMVSEIYGKKELEHIAELGRLSLTKDNKKLLQFELGQMKRATNE